MAIGIGLGRELEVEIDVCEEEGDTFKKLGVEMEVCEEEGDTSELMLDCNDSGEDSEGEELEPLSPDISTAGKKSEFIG